MSATGGAAKKTMTVEDYRKKAKALGVTGYSSKTKDQLKSAIYRKKAAKKTVKKPAKKTTSTKRKTTKRKTTKRK